MEPELQSFNTALRILLVEDDPADADLALRELQGGGYQVSSAVVESEGEFRERLAAGKYDVVVADYRLPGWNGMEAVEILQQAGLDTPVILVTGSLGDVLAVECIKRGATDYVLKDNLARLPISVRRALAEKQSRDQQRRAEKQLAEKAEELARSNRDLEQFAYVASHDLQEPLRMVATYTQLLAERYGGKLDDNAGKYIHYAVGGALRMQALIRDLLTYSRVGRSGTVRARVDCNAVVDEAIRNLQSAVEESHATIHHDELPVIVADHSQVMQLFQNLIGNAIKFRGTEPPRISIRAANHSHDWLFSVSDNGIGIAPQYAETVFVIFQRLHTCQEYPGSGVGLAICKKIVQQHGGKIWVESRPGQGSTFQFTLPVTPGQEGNA